MADDVTTFNLAYENARRAVQAQVNFWSARAGNLALSDVDRSTAITVAATLGQSLLDLAEEYHAKLTQAAELAQPGDPLLMQAAGLLQNLATATAAAMSADAIVQAVVGAITALSQLVPALPAAAGAAHPAAAVHAMSPLDKAMHRTALARARQASKRLQDSP
jgi:hypothetical protein